jgi:transcriptional regulator with XRE-family HTH domain
VSGVHPLVAQLTDLRRAAGIDRAAVAARLSVRTQHVKMWELGLYEPGWVKLSAWAAVLGCTVVVRPRAGIPVFGDPIEVLCAVRKRRGLSQAELAALAGFTQSQLSQWERRVHAPGLDAVTAWADGLGCELQLAPVAVLAVAS